MLAQSHDCLIFSFTLLSLSLILYTEDTDKMPMKERYLHGCRIEAEA